MDILIRNFRSFYGQQYRIPIKPFTILVGENSTGKSSLMAAIAAICDTKRFPLNPGFNVPPFELGAYETIATRNINGRCAESFELGFEERDPKSGSHTKLIATYVERKGRAEFLRFSLESDAGEMYVRLDDGHLLSLSIKAPFKSGEKRTLMQLDGRGSVPEFSSMDLRTFIGMRILPAVFDKLQKEVKGGQNVRPGDAERVLRTLSTLTGRITPCQESALAVAPLRSKPRRTYDTFADEYDAEGAHIPLRLAQVLERQRSSRVQTLRRALCRFGRESGLFDDVEIRRLRGKPSSAFQVCVRIGRRHVNLVDVGYGVSQSLPIIVQSVLSTQSRTTLFQQPEVHLHPRAQAALGSFFVSLLVKEHKRFVVETHSDYLIDRVRRDVAVHAVDPGLIGILYFERTSTRCKIHVLTLDRDGNIEGAPPSYRRFFLDEEMQLLSRAKGK